MNSQDNCKGCKTYNLNHNKCYYQIYNKSVKCPCSTCLIKGICDTPCEEFHIAERKFNEKSRIEVWACKGRAV
jgi:hypothetical protein